MVAVSTQADLIQQIDKFNSGASPNLTITLTGNITLTADLPLITGSGTLTINGSGTPSNYTISGADQYRGIFAQSGTVNLQDVNLDDMVAQGGAGGAGFASGGGGAGLGGGLFVGDDAHVTLTGVNFDSD